MPEESAVPRRGLLRSPREVLAGVSLVLLAGFALATTARLDSGTLRGLGPGMLPRAVAVALAAVGVGLVALALLKPGPPLGRWPLRGPVFVSLAVVAFAITIRTAGLAVAGPLVVVVSGAASSESRPKELVVFALAMSAFCLGLFRYALGLPIPVLVIPGLVNL